MSGKELVIVNTKTLSVIEPTKYEPPVYDEPYCVNKGCLCRTVYEKGEERKQRLCNFLPWITREIVRYSAGVEECERSFLISGILYTGELLPQVEVKATELAGFNWLYNRWPGVCLIDPVYSAEKHIAAAIRSTAVNAEITNIFRCTGWTDLSDENIDFLLPGNNSYEIDLRGKLAHYAMADGYDVMDICESAELITKDIMPHEISDTLMAYTFLSPLNPFLQEAGFEPKFILSLIGPTGSMKSTVAALFLGFFGHFTATDSPATFRDTPNSILFSAGVIRHALFVIDDFHPSTQNDVKTMTNTLENIVRYFGDRTGRERMSSDLRQITSAIPRGNAIITAESTPVVAESSLARMLCLEMSPGQIDIGRLSVMQLRSANEVLMRCMFAYIEWLKKKHVNPKEKRKNFIEELRIKYTLSRMTWSEKLKKEGRPFHMRMPDTLACLSVGYEYLLEFFSDMGAIGTDGCDEKKELAERFADTLFGIAMRQTRSAIEQSASHMYISKLMSLIESGDVSIVEKETRPDMYPKNLIGFCDEKYCYVFLDASHRHVKKLCREQGEDFPFSGKQVAAALASENVIESKDGKNTFTRRFGGKSKRVMIMYRERISQILKEMS